MTTAWQQLQSDSPELADAVRTAFAANLHHVLGTVRPDGSPRLSGTEVDITDERITLGMMPDSLKLRDVTRDPRVEIHAAPIDVKLVNGDVRLTGVLSPAETLVDPPGQMFELALRAAVRIQVADDLLVVTTWRPGRGVQVTKRR